MAQARPIVSTYCSRKFEKVHGVPQTAIDGILKRLSRVELPHKEHLEDYMRYKWRLNHKPATFLSSQKLSYSLSEPFVFRQGRPVEQLGLSIELP